MSIDFIPEDFSGRVAGHVTADDKFDRFVEACQFATRTTYINRGYSLTPPVIIVANEENVWPLGSPGGTLETTLPWLREQMKERSASWFFFAQPTKVGWYRKEEALDVGDEEVLEKFEDALEPGIFWYAAARSGSWFVRRAGLARFLDEDLSPFRDGLDSQPVIFDSVLA